MPIGKNASYRYRLIDQALRNTGRRWTYEGLLDFICEKLEDEFDVNLNQEKERALSPRQLADDIRIMRKDPPEGYGAPIIRKEGNIYYEDSTFSINDNPLINSDIDSLKEILRLIKPFQSLPQLHELETIIGKVQGTISHNKGDQIIELEHNPNVKGLLHIETLYPLIKDEKIVMVNYKPFKWDKEIEYRLHPFLIKEYNNRWFLLGWIQEENRFIVLGLDRINKIRETEGAINNQKRAELLNLQRNIIGVSMAEASVPCEIRLWVNPSQLPYMLTKPLHPSQKLVDEHAEGSVLSYQLVPNFELEQTLMMFGEWVKVLEPLELKEKLVKRFQATLENYQL